jgi:hypothetical protein
VDHDLLPSTEESKAIRFVRERSPATLEGDFEAKALMFLRESPPTKMDFGKHASDVLKVWYFANLSYPYPSQEAKDYLVEETKLPSSTLVDDLKSFPYVVGS